MRSKVRFLSAVAGGVILVVMVLMASAFLQGCGVVEHVTSTQSIIQNYENFYQINGDIKAMASNVKLAKEKLDRASEATKAQAEIEYYGIRQNLNNLISEYNSKSKMITRNLWKASDLPYQINMDEVLQ